MEKQSGLDPPFMYCLGICPSFSNLKIHFKRFCMAKGMEVLGFIVATDLLFACLFGARNS